MKDKIFRVIQENTAILPIVASIFSGVTLICVFIFKDSIDLTALGIVLQLSAIAIISYYYYQLLNKMIKLNRRISNFEVPRRFDEWSDVQPIIIKLLSSQFGKKKTHIRCMGVALHVSWKTLREEIEKYHEKNKIYPNVEIELKVLDPTYSYWGKLGEEWRRRNLSFFQSVDEFKKKVSTSSDSNSVSIKVFTYSYAPNWHGLLINNIYLFRSSCLYRNGEYRVHRNPYVYFRCHENEYSNMQVEEFNNWFETDATPLGSSLRFE